MAEYFEFNKEKFLENVRQRIENRWNEREFFELRNQLRREANRPQNLIYQGTKPDFGTWVEVYAFHRDSDIIQVANYDELKDRFTALDPAGIGWIEERFQHFLVGWVKSLRIDIENDETCFVYYEFCQQLKAYPVVQEDRYEALCKEIIKEGGDPYND